MPSIPLTELAGLIESRINQVIQEQNLGGKKNLKASKKASAEAGHKSAQKCGEIRKEGHREGQEKIRENGQGKK
jgi:hypothetical protein